MNDNQNPKTFPMAQDQLDVLIYALCIGSKFARHMTKEEAEILYRAAEILEGLTYLLDPDLQLNLSEYDLAPLVDKHHN